MVKPNLLRRGGCTAGPMYEGEEGSENGRATGSFPTCGIPAVVTWLGIAVGKIFESATAGSEEVLDSPVRERAAPANAVCGGCFVLIPVVFIDKFFVFLGLLLGEPDLSPCCVGDGVNETFRGAWSIDKFRGV